MRAPISVVIPTLNAEAALGPCLAALGEGLHEGLIRELIVSDGGSTDATLRLAEAAGAVIVTGPASRGGQLRRGVAAAQGEWLLVIHADSVLLEGWGEVVLSALTTKGAHHFRLAFDAAGFAPRIVAGWANLRSWLFGLPYGDQGLLIDRASYDAVGGYPDLPLMEDVALARALRGRLRALPVTVITSAEKYQRQGWILRGARNLGTLMRYLLGADPEALAERYRR
ncbi:MAG: TIGR04283 family arsenosugar biosynthesis glycosyltransferase [Paracoccaceae bacterium]|nr:TIGR04283 family arsenosugar biosynthesis glycosyltransferase [Paracoccaceae bacterium]